VIQKELFDRCRDVEVKIEWDDLTSRGSMC